MKISENKKLIQLGKEASRGSGKAVRATEKRNSTLKLSEIKFELDFEQIQKLNTWKEKIKKQHGEYGYFDYVFSPVGMGTAVKVVSQISGNIIDLTDYKKW